MMTNEEKKTEVSAEEQYWIAMDAFLKLRGELGFDEQGYKQKIITKSSIISQCYYPLRECGFFHPTTLASVHEVTGATFLTTTFKHRTGFSVSDVCELVPWTKYPDGYEKQIKCAFDQQCSRTYIERQSLLNLLLIQDGFNPEEMAMETDVKTGKIKFITAEQAQKVRDAVGENKGLMKKVAGAFNIRSANEIKESDFDEIMGMIEKNTIRTDTEKK